MEAVADMAVVEMIEGDMAIVLVEVTSKFHILSYLYVKGMAKKK